MRLTTTVNAILGDEGLTYPSQVTEMEDVAPSQTSFSNQKMTEDLSGEGDDEELQEMLALRRRRALKRRKIDAPEDFVRNIQTSEEFPENNPSNVGGLVIDDTSEFVRGIEMTQVKNDQGHTSARMESHELPVEMEIDAHDSLTPNDLVGTEIEEESESLDALSSLELVGGSMAATLAALKRSGNGFSSSANQARPNRKSRVQQVFGRRSTTTGRDFSPPTHAKTSPRVRSATTTG
jgi:SART-1 family